MKQLEVLNEYYTNLDYDDNVQDALYEIYFLSETVRFPSSVTLLERVERVINVIQENISVFQSVCRHVDIIDTILEYLTTYVATCNKDETIEKENLKQFLTVLLTIFNMCKEFAIQSFLIYPIFIDSIWKIEQIQEKVKLFLNMNLASEMIIFEDSDLYSVINCLITTDNFPLRKIWVHKQIKEKFVWLVKRHSDVAFPFDTFESLADLNLYECLDLSLYILSIWSEDIANMKNLALTLSRNIIFINTYMDFSGGITLIPYDEMWYKQEESNVLSGIHPKRGLTDLEQNVNVVHFSHIAEMNDVKSVCKLFYDNTYQEPVKGMYWKHDGILFANTTIDDITLCHKSVLNGYKIWSIMSINSRIAILSNLMFSLMYFRKSVLAAIIAKWLRFPSMYSTVKGYVTQNRMVEITRSRIPLGVFYLREKNENVLFFRLMQILIAGNCAVVIFDANYCNPIQYCRMFSTCGIPSGVINVLSHEDSNVLGYHLLSEEYTDYENRMFSKGSLLEAYTKPYEKLTMSKDIVLRLG